MKLCRSILSFKIFWNPSAEMKTDSNELPKTCSFIFWTSCYPNTYSGLLSVQTSFDFHESDSKWTIQSNQIKESCANLDGHLDQSGYFSTDRPFSSESEVFNLKIKFYYEDPILRNVLDFDSLERDSETRTPYNKKSFKLFSWFPIFI